MMPLFSGQRWRNGWWIRLGATGTGLSWRSPWRFRLLGRIKPQKLVVTFSNGHVWEGDVYPAEERDVE